MDFCIFLYFLVSWPCSVEHQEHANQVSLNTAGLFVNRNLMLCLSVLGPEVIRREFTVRVFVPNIELHLCFS